jgi:hypothetical protein
MTMRTTILGMLVTAAGALAQPVPVPLPVGQAMPDAPRVRDDLSSLLDRYPPTLRRAFKLDPNLLTNQSYLASYPALVNFLNAHGEIIRNPAFYLNGLAGNDDRPDRDSRILDIWRDTLGDLAGFAAAGIAIGLLTWLIRTVINYRRWLRLVKVQTDVHSKLLDRFTGHDDLLAYIQSPAGSKFLQSSPIALDSGARSLGAPLGRILWSVQAGVVLTAAGIGLQFVSARTSDEVSQPLHAMGVLGVALGLGFVAAAAVAYLLSRKLGLIESSATPDEQL